MLKEFKFFLVILSGLISGCANPPEIKPDLFKDVSTPNFYASAPFDLEKLEPGDIVLRRGFGLVSDYIVTLSGDNLNLSHCGVLVNESEKWWIVHSILKDNSEESGLLKEPLETFCKESILGSMVVVRFRKEKDLRLNFAMATLTESEKNIPFDKQMDMNDSSAYYCTELLWRMAEKNGIEGFFNELTTTEGKSIIGFRNFFEEENFELIYKE